MKKYVFLIFLIAFFCFIFVNRAQAASATFLGVDTITQGTWKTVYGVDGYSINADSNNLPSYINMSTSGASSYTWAASTTDVRALQKSAVGSTDRIAATWYSTTNFSFDINITDGNYHKVSIYMIDYDGTSRSQTIQILDSSDNVLDTQSSSSFNAGKWFSWQLSGHTIMRFTNVPPSVNAVISGIFFDTLSVPSSPVGASAIGGDSKVNLSWSAPSSNGNSPILDYVIEYKLSSEPTTWSIFADGVSVNTSAAVTGLTNGLSYDFRISAVNLIGQGNPGNITTATSGATWYSPYWSYRAKISIDHTKVSNTDQLYFPVLINRTDVNWKDTLHNGHVGQADGGDILFTASDGITKLDHEIEKYDPATGELIAWVEIPTVATLADTDFYMYYGNNTGVADQWNITGTWDSGGDVAHPFKGVWHLKDPTNPVDSANAYNGTNVNTTAVAGQVGGAANFSGSGQYITLPAGVKAGISDGTQITLSGWFKGSSIQSMIRLQDSNYIVLGWGGRVIISNDGGTGGGVYINGNAMDGNWHYVVATWQKNTTNGFKVYVDGVITNQRNSANVNLPTLSGVSYLGTWNTASEFTNGIVDEARVLNTARSADWVKTEYNNQKNPATFFSNITEEAITIPDIPTELSAVFGNAQAALSWVVPASDGGSAITDYVVEYKITSGSEWSIFADGVSVNASAIVTGLTNGLSYDFRISAVNAVGQGDPSTTATATPATVPDAPTNLIPTLGNTQISLSWTAPASNGGSAITDYVIEYKISTEPTTWSIFADGTSTTSSATVTGLTNGLSYNFKVSAVNIVGQGSASTTATATPMTVPDAPTIGTATAGNTEATVTFTPPASNGGSAITGYTVTSSPGGITGTGSTSPITVTGLTNGTEYTFTVTATNAVGTSSSSASSNSVTPATVPDTPTALSAVPGNAQMALTWSAPVWNGGSAITDYVVEYKLSSELTTWSVFSDGTSIALSATVTSLNNGSSYDFRVSGVNVGGQGNASMTATATPRTVPDAPTNAVANRGNGEAQITFSAPLNNGGAVITNYAVTSSPGNYTATGSASPITVAGLTNGVEYTFTVTATNAAGTGLASTSSNSVTPATVPDAPTSPVATFGNTEASVAFSPPASNGGSAITGYTVTSNPGGITGTGSTSPITVTGLTNGTPYTFTVTATNDVGTGSASLSSNSVIPMTVPGAPTIGTATAGNTEATVTFTPPVSNGGSAITGYTVTSSPGGITGTGSTSPITVTGLTNGTHYTFSVTATNAVGNSSSSESSNSVTPVTVPDAPTSLSPTAGNAQVALAWTAPAWNGGESVTDYIVNYKLTSEPTTWSVFADGVSDTTSATVTGLTNGLSYDFRVSAVNVAGQGSPSSLATAIPVTVPDAPTIGTATRGNTQATVTFTPPASNGGSAITGYTVTSSPGGITGTGSASPITVTGLTNGTEYTFTVTATNAVGTGSSSASSNSVTPATVPDTPTALSATPGNRQATISFTPPASNGGSTITGYTVTSSPGGITGTGSASPITVTGLTNGTEYTFTMTATNEIGASIASASSNSITLSTEPGAPGNLAATVLGESIGLSWSAPVSNGGSAVTDYVIEYQLTTGGVWSVFADALSTQTTAAVTGLSNNNSYDFRVSAKNEIGQGTPSNIVSATPGEPAQVLIQSFSDLTNPSIGTNVRITNEGTGNYEYQYTWCVTDSEANVCGGGDDLFSSTAAKLIRSGENWDTTLISNVATPGSYYFHIKVLYGSQSSSASQSFTAVATFPDAPIIGTATAGNTEATVTFTPPVSNGGSAITGYTVTSSPGGITATGSASPIAVTGLTNGTPYTFTVTATNVIGTSPASAPSSAIVPATVPDMPTDVIATAGNAQVVLTWSAPVWNGGSAITDYVIEYKLSSEPTVWSTFADGISAETATLITGLTNELSYDFRISAVNIMGRSEVTTASATLPEVIVPPPANNTGSHGGGGYLPVNNQTKQPEVPAQVKTPNEILETEIKNEINLPTQNAQSAKTGTTQNTNIKAPEPVSTNQISKSETGKNKVSATPKKSAKTLSRPRVRDQSPSGAWYLLSFLVGVTGTILGRFFFLVFRINKNY